MVERQQVYRTEDGRIVADEQKIGGEVHQQAVDNSVGNTEPVMLRNTIVGVVSALLAILVLGGYVTGDESRELEAQAGIIIPALLLAVQIISGIWSRQGAYSPKSAAEIAIVNASAPMGAAPTLDPPP